MYDNHVNAPTIRTVTAENTKSLAQVPASLESLGQNVDRLGMTINVLIARLTPAMSKCETGIGASDEPDYSCDLAASIQQQAQALRRLDEYLRDALSWLEI